MDEKALAQAKRVAEMFKNSIERFARAEAKTIGVEDEKYISPLQYVDYGWLGGFARGQTNFGKESEKNAGRGFILTENARLTIDELVREMRIHFNQRRSTSETDRDQMAEDKKEPLYFPPSILSTRTFMNYAYNVTLASVFLDLLLLPEEVFPTHKVIGLLERPGGIPVDEYSIYRLHEMILTAAPGDPVFVPPTARKANNGPLIFGDEIKLLLENPFDRREQWLLRSIETDRNAFASKYKEKIAKIRESADYVSSILTRYFGSDFLTGNKLHGIEEILYHLKTVNKGTP
jgi:hypothetical protein